MDAVAALRAGGAVILPTDTVYGLVTLPRYAERLAALKDRPDASPVALLCAELETLLELVPEARGRVEDRLPGGYTLVLPNPERRYPELGGGETIGVRVPVLPPSAYDVVAAVGAVAATSANRHGGPDPRRLDEISALIRGACAAEVDGGDLPGVPSTVLDLTGPEPRVLRGGAAPAE